MCPSQASIRSTRVVTPCCVSWRLPGKTVIFVRSSGSAADISLPVASPLSLSTASAAASARCSHASSRPFQSLRCLRKVARSRAAMARAAAASTTGASSRLTAKSVRRMDSSFTSATSS